MREALRSLLALVLLIAAGGAGFALYQHFSGRSGGSNALPSHRIAFSMPDMAGKTRHISHWDGKTVLLNFWASWCGPCRKEMPLLIKAQRQYGGRGLQVIGIAIDTPSDARHFARSMHVNYPVLIPSSQQQGISLAARYGDRIGGLPYSVVYRPDGRVVGVHAGELHRPALETLLHKALHKASG
ncbi:MAG TPA: TlpA disulfide reductase family protein [Gammaproteobacteria bacterium]|nr:TlpA disulfide reductase family protein [Gammaproteobacteria bacterium]